jgi:tetratricopeptide (TPR) repeat protein
MPDSVTLLADGVRYQLGGLLDRALHAFTQVAETAADPDLRAEALVRRAGVHRARCEWDAAVAAAREVAGTNGLADRGAEALNAEAVVYLTRGDLEHAVPLLERVLAVASDDRVCGIAAQNLGTIAAQRGDFAGAERHFLDSRRRFAAARYEFGEATALNNAAAVALDRGEPEDALRAGEEARMLAGRVGDQELLGIAAINCAEALARLDRHAEAEELASSALGHFTAAGNALREVECLRLLGDISRARGDAGTARRCYDRGLERAERIGSTREQTELASRIADLEARA